MAAKSRGFNSRIERKQAEELLRASEQKFMRFFSRMPIPLGVVSMDGVITHFNDRCTEVLGYTRDDVPTIEEWWQRAYPDESYRRQVLDTWNTAVAAAVNEGREIEPHEYRVTCKNGAERIMLIGGSVFEDCVLATFIDITERKQMQEASNAHLRDLLALNQKLSNSQAQLLQSEKMAMIGQLAAGIAHEINNPVGFVLSNIGSLENYLKDFLALLDAYENAEPALDAVARATVQGLRQELDIAFLREDVVALLTETRQGIDRVRKIVKSLMDFSRMGADDDWQWLDVNAGLESTLNVAWNELKYKTTVNKEYGQLPKIHGLPAQLNQVFMNLLVNAAQAIATKGVVTLRSGQQDEEVWIEIEDTGCGIPAENLQRIFDPFFTTKDVGKGTGLGLSVSYNIVQKHQGRIEVRSEVGKGSIFRVWLPINAGEANSGTGCGTAAM